MTVKVIDSVKAVKAQACCNELSKLVTAIELDLGSRGAVDIAHVKELLIKYGQRDGK